MSAYDLNVTGDVFAFKWTDEITEQLILWRGANKTLFTGKRNAAMKGFEAFIKEMGLVGKVTVACTKKKWENLKQRYMELKNLPIGRSTEGGEMTAATWKWYRVMDKALGSSHGIISLVIGSSSVPDGSVLSFTSEEKASTSYSSTCWGSAAPEPPFTGRASKRAKKEPVWLLAIKELERREDAREAEWERMMMEREERRDQEMREREDRRDQEMRERDDRRDREMREREKHLIAENREREDRLAREAAVREERFLRLMEFLVKK